MEGWGHGAHAPWTHASAQRDILIPIITAGTRHVKNVHERVRAPRSASPGDARMYFTEPERVKKKKNEKKMKKNVVNQKSTTVAWFSLFGRLSEGARGVPPFHDTRRRRGVLLASTSLFNIRRRTSRAPSLSNHGVGRFSGVEIK